MKEMIGSFDEFERLVQGISVPCLFRGQANALHGLVPGIGRPHPKYRPTPELEKALFRQFKNRARPYLKPPLPMSDWDWLVLAQHHGLKTRLLDWTTDWRVALYFATPPHDEMHRVPFSIFLLPRPQITPYETLPRSPFTCKRDYYFQPPHLHCRITAQSSYISIHSKPHQAVNRRDLVQFSFLPFPEHRRRISEFLASSRVTAAEIIPGLDGICRALVDEPRITAQIELPVPQERNQSEWRKIPSCIVDQKVGTIRSMMLRERRLELILDLVDVERLIGIPCYLREKLYGYLKYGNRAHSRFEFLLASGNATATVLGTDKVFSELKLLRKHIEKLVPSELVVIRRARK